MARAGLYLDEPRRHFCRDLGTPPKLAEISDANRAEISDRGRELGKGARAGLARNILNGEWRMKNGE